MERDINGQINTLIGALNSDNEAAEMAAALTLLQGALEDLNRIATALENIARQAVSVPTTAV